MIDLTPQKTSHNKYQKIITQLYSLEAEKAILGSMLAQPLEVIDEIASFLSKNDFFSPAHQIIFECLLDLHENGGGVDVMLVFDYLKNRNKEKDISPGYLAELLNSFSSHSNASSYARIILDKKMLRDLYDASMENLRDIQNMPESVGKVIDRAESRISEKILITSQINEKPFSVSIVQSASDAIKWANQGGGMRGLPTGFKSVDDLTGGWRNGQFIVIGARPGKGKTALALTFARALVRDQWNDLDRDRTIPGYPGGMFSMEMGQEELDYRLLAAHGGIGLTALLKGELSDNERIKVREVSEGMKHWKFFIDCQGGLDISQIRSRGRRWKRKHGIRFIIVDYIQLAHSYKFQQNKNAEVGDIARNLKDMAMELQVPVIGLAQLNRGENEEDPPTLSRLKDSGAIEEAADVVFLLHEHMDRSEHNGALRRHTLHLAKQRNGVQDRRIELEFLAWKTLFTLAK